MNASDIVNAKRDGRLYKSYYHPTVFQSTVVTTLIPISSFSTNTGTYISSFASTVKTAYMYKCNPAIISYELANSINNGTYVCGNKTPSVLTWNASPNIYASNTYAEDGAVITSINSHAVRPLICNAPIIYQELEADNECTSCDI
jgi:hypothetical protein